jgi:hypothetical protein
MEVAFNRERELGEVAVAGDATELAFRFEHAGSGPAQAHVTRLPALDVPRLRRTISIIDSHGFVD